MMTRLLLVLLALAAMPARSGEWSPIKLMSFNIRYGTAGDGANRWAERRGLVMDVFERRDADVVGLQEALGFQIDEITRAHPGYGVIGVGRDDGRVRGEFSAILYRTERFIVDASGTFWLSDTPGVVASASWGNRITRVCTWARLIDRTTGMGLYVFNTHFDHESQASRERSARLIAGRIGAREHPDPAVLMGDFNAGETNPAMVYLTDRSAEAGGPGLIDIYRNIRPDEEPSGTFNAFRGVADGERIDAILVTDGLGVTDAGIDRTDDGGRYPSDHFPVWGVVTLMAGDE